MRNQQKQLAEILLRGGLVTPAKLEQALHEQRRWGSRLLPLVIELGFVQEEPLVRLLAQELRLPIVTLDNIRQISPEALRRVPVSMCEQYDLIPIGYDVRSHRLQMGLTDPSDQDILHELHSLTGCELELYVIGLATVRKAIRLYFYGENTAEVFQVASGLTPLPGTSSGASFGGNPPEATGEFPRGGRGLPPPTGGFHPTGMVPGSASGMHPLGGISGMHPLGGVSGMHPTGGVSGMHPTGGVSGMHPTGGVSGVHPGGGRGGSSGMFPIPGVSGEQVVMGASSSTGGSASLWPSTEQHHGENVSAFSNRGSSSSGESEQVLKQRVHALEQEVMMLHRSFAELEGKFSSEMKEIQQLLRSRFQEQRMLVRGLLDMLVIRGHLHRDEIVEMLNRIVQGQGS